MNRRGFIINTVAVSGGLLVAPNLLANGTNHKGTSIMTNLVISNVVIKQDENLRYRLNDLHKASGLPKSKAPSEWLRIQNAQEFIANLKLENTVTGITEQLILKG